MPRVSRNSVLATAALAICAIALAPCAVVLCLIAVATASPESSSIEIWVAMATVASAIANVALVVAAVVALRSIGESRRDRNAVAMTDLSQRWDAKEFREVRRKIKEHAGLGRESGQRFAEKLIALRDAKYGEYSELLTEPGFLEDLALSIKYGGIYFDIVKDSLGYVIWDRWCLWEPAVMALRRERQEDTVFEHFQGMAENIKSRLSGLPELEEWNGPKY